MLFCGMTTTTNPPSSARTFALPNLLTTGASCGARRGRAACIGRRFFGYGYGCAGWRSHIFVIAGITDVLDGYVARMWAQQSTFRAHAGSDADKLLVSSLPADARGRRHDPRLGLWPRS